MLKKTVKLLFGLLLLMSFTYSSTAYTLQFADKGQINRLHWSKSVINITLSTSLIKSQNIRAESKVLEAVQKSLETWENASNIKFKVVWSDDESISPAGNSGDGINLITIAQTPENLLLFTGDAIDTAARTRTFFNRRGIITEADIVLNPYSQFATDESIGTFDLEATITHEVGHLLGLEHSSVIGATMYEHQGKNGIYNLPNTAPRSLAEDDIAGIRAIYGTKEPAENCCGTLSGRISSNGRVSGEFQVWLEEPVSGRVAAGILTSAGGKFKIEGLKPGKYKVFAQDNSAGNGSAELIGEFDVETGKTTNVSGRVSFKRRGFDFQFIGFNGQISEVAAPVNKSRTYLIYVGGKNLEADKLKINFNSPYFTVNPNSLVEHDYGSNISVFSFELTVSADAKPGEYSFSLQSENGAKDYIIGGIVIKDTINPWFKYNF